MTVYKKCFQLLVNMKNKKAKNVGFFLFCFFFANFIFILPVLISWYFLYNTIFALSPMKFFFLFDNKTNQKYYIIVETNIFLYSVWFIQIKKGPSWSWLYGSWIYIYLCNQCLSPLILWVRTSLMTRCTRYNIVW